MFSFLQRNTKFYDLFEQSAKNLHDASLALADLVADYTDIQRKAQHLSDLENEGDAIIHDIFRQLHGTFVTPLDREDIALLAHSLDDVLDMIEEAANVMVVYNVPQPTAVAQEFATLIQQSAAQIAAAVPRLRNHHEHQRILHYCVEINRLENDADRLLRSALGALFNDNLPIMDVIKLRTLYEVLEDATDRAEDVANVLEGIVLKHA